MGEPVQQILWLLFLCGHAHLLLLVTMHVLFRLPDNTLKAGLLIGNGVLWALLALVTGWWNGFPDFSMAWPVGEPLAQLLRLWQWALTVLGAGGLLRQIHWWHRPVAVPKLLSHSGRERRLDAGAMRTAWGKLSVRAGLGVLEVNEYEVRVTGLDPGLDGLLIAHLSDLHAGREVAERLAEAARAELEAVGPDLVAMTGDFLGPAGTLPAGAELAGRFTAPLGSYAVLGNHDFRLDAGQVTRALEAQGIRVLRNHGVRVQRGAGCLWVAGVDDFWSDTRDLGAALAGRAPGEPCLLLAHNPDHVLEAAKLGVDLQLSGHTHGGQIAPWPVGPVFIPSRHGVRFAQGMHQVGETVLYVSRGVAGGPAVKVGVRPELALLRLRASE